MSVSTKATECGDNVEQLAYGATIMTELERRDSLMGALFDLTFKKFVAPTIAKIVYVLAMIVIAISYLTFVISAFNANTVFGVLVLLVIGPLAALLYLAFIRVGLEALLAMILTAQNTAELVQLQGGQPPAPGSATQPGGSSPNSPGGSPTTPPPPVP